MVVQASNAHLVAHVACSPGTNGILHRKSGVFGAKCVCSAKLTRAGTTSEIINVSAEFSWSDLGDSTYHFPPWFCLLMLAVDTVVYAALAWYFSIVLPGEYGTSLPFYFPFTYSFWFPGSVAENASLLGTNVRRFSLRRQGGC